MSWWGLFFVSGHPFRLPPQPAACRCHNHRPIEGPPSCIESDIMKKTLIHWRLSIPDRPSLAEDRHFQRKMIQILSGASRRLRAKFYSAFCENFQFHLLVEISPERVAAFETLVSNLTRQAVNSEAPTNLRFNALDRSILKEARSLSFSEFSESLVELPPENVSIAINPKTSIHRFRIVINSRPIWATKRCLLIQAPLSKGFFRNPMKSARA